MELDALTITSSHNEIAVWILGFCKACPEMGVLVLGQSNKAVSSYCYFENDSPCVVYIFLQVHWTGPPFWSGSTVAVVHCTVKRHQSTEPPFWSGGAFSFLTWSCLFDGILLAHQVTCMGSWKLHEGAVYQVFVSVSCDAPTTVLYVPTIFLHFPHLEVL